MRSAARREAAILRYHEVTDNVTINLIKENINSSGTKRRRVTIDEEERVKRLRQEAMDEVKFMMNMYGGNNVQIEDFWQKKAIIVG